MELESTTPSVRIVPNPTYGRDHPEDGEYEKNLIKIAVAGDSACGKTSILRRLQTGNFCRGVKATVSVDLVVLRLAWSDGRRAKIMLFDMVGDDRFRPHQPCNFMGGIEAAMMVFDCKRPETYKSFDIWQRRLDLDIGEDHRRVVLCNKVDRLSGSERVNTMALDWMAGARETYGGKFFWTSAVTGEGCLEALAYLARKILRERSKKKIVEHRAEMARLGYTNGTLEPRSRCCK